MSFLAKMTEGRAHLLFVVLLMLINSAFSNDCPQGWYSFQERCYGFGEDVVTWGDAEEYCRVYGANLAEIEDSEENAFLQNLARTKQAAGVWIGGIDIFSEGNWEWISTTQPITGFTDWAPNEPNNGGGEDCLMLFQPFNYQWNDSRCDTTYNFVCEMGASGSNLVVG